MRWVLRVHQAQRAKSRTPDRVEPPAKWPGSRRPIPAPGSDIRESSRPGKCFPKIRFMSVSWGGAGLLARSRGYLWQLCLISAHHQTARSKQQQLSNDVLPFTKKKGYRWDAILTDNGVNFAGKTPIHTNSIWSSMTSSTARPAAGPQTMGLLSASTERPRREFFCTLFARSCTNCGSTSGRFRRLVGSTQYRATTPGLS